MTEEIYTSLSNGDYNLKDIDLKDCFGRLEFEFGTGEKWVILSSKRLTDEQYDKIMEILK